MFELYHTGKIKAQNNYLSVTFGNKFDMFLPRNAAVFILTINLNLKLNWTWIFWFLLDLTWEQDHLRYSRRVNFYFYL